MPPPKAEAYLKKLMNQYWSSKTYDNTQGSSAVKKFNPQSILDNFWFAKRAGSEGTKIDRLAGGENLGKLEDLEYFLKKLYKSLKVPVSRLNSDDGYKDDMNILREELKFAKFIVRMQQQFSEGLKNGFITHLKLRQIWSKLDLKENNIDIEFNVPVNFFEMREAQKQELKTTSFNNITQSDAVSKTYALKKYMGWNDYYSPGTYKYGSSFYVPDYEDSIYLSRSIGVVPRLKSNFYVSDDNYELNSLETPYNESDVLITNKWVNQVSTGSRILPTEPPKDNIYNNQNPSDRSAQLQVKYTMTKSSDELAYENKVAIKDKIQSQILGYATNAPLNIQPKYSAPPITNK
jgi:hypothetical protein